MRVWVDREEIEVEHQLQVEYFEREIKSGKTIVNFATCNSGPDEIHLPEHVHVHVYWNIKRQPAILFREFGRIS
jgi:hypothetical protein